MTRYFVISFHVWAPTHCTNWPHHTALGRRERCARHKWHTFYNTKLNSTTQLNFIVTRLQLNSWTAGLLNIGRNKKFSLQNHSEKNGVGVWSSVSSIYQKARNTRTCNSVKNNDWRAMSFETGCTKENTLYLYYQFSSGCNCKYVVYRSSWNQIDTISVNWRLLGLSNLQTTRA